MFLNKFHKYRTSLFVFLIISFFPTSCIVLKPYNQPPVTAEESLFRGVGTGDTSNLASVSWKTLFNDPDLQLLIQEAIDNNPDMLIAVARIKKAEANLQQSKLAFLPTLGVKANTSYQNTESDGTGFGENYQAYGYSSWEADVWGKLASTKRASMASFLESEAYKRAVQTKLVANVANAYFSLLAYDEMLKVTEKTLDIRKSDVETIKLLKESDVVTGADLVQSEANIYSAAVSIPDIKQSIFETENSLCLLLGRTPGIISRGTLASQEISEGLKTGVPAQLLANRPDIKQAELKFRYYFEMTNLARSYFYPSFTITADKGLLSDNLSFNPTSWFWNLAGGLTQPILNQGINKQRLKVAKANQEEYLISYRQALLQAGEEVANAMTAYQTATEKMSLRSKQIEYLQKSVDYTMELLKYTSTTNYTDVLTSEERLLTAQLSFVKDKLQQLNAVVTLYHSLGGGWK